MFRTFGFGKRPVAFGLRRTLAVIAGVIACGRRITLTCCVTRKPLPPTWRLGSSGDPAYVLVGLVKEARACLCQ